MAARNIVDNLDRKVLECPICMKRLAQPRTLPCLHTYCLECLENWAVVKCKLQCPLCSKTFQIPEGGVKKLAPNITIDNLLEYVKTMEEDKDKDEDGSGIFEKEEECATCICGNISPTHYCKECEKYVCIDCKKNHKSSLLKSKKHTLVPMNELSVSLAKEPITKNCSVHPNNPLEFFCKRCLKSACIRCKDQFHKVKSEHLVVPVSDICTEIKDEFNTLFQMAKRVKTETQSQLKTYENNAALLQTNKDVCKRNVDAYLEGVINQLTEYSQILKKDIDEVNELQTHVLRTKMNKSQSLLYKISNTIFELESKFGNASKMDSIESQMLEVNNLRSRLYEIDIEETETDIPLNLTFLPSSEFMSKLNQGIGSIISTEDLYRVAKSDIGLSIEITEGEMFAVRVDCFEGNKKCELMPKLRNPLDEIIIPDIFQENGQYVITDRCNISGKWLLSISTGKTFIQGSPVTIDVQKGGISATIPNILDYMEYTKDTKVMNVCFHEGFLLVSSASQDVLRFKQSGEFVDKIIMPPGTRVSCLCVVDKMLLAYSDLGNRCVTTCSHSFKEVLSFGEGIVKQPRGLAFRRDVSDIYVVDIELHCVFRFDFQTGKLISKIGSAGKGIGQMLKPQDIAITRNGNLLFADFGNHRVSMFNKQEKFIKILIGCGKEDGKVVGPSGIVICENDSFIVSSNHKLQLFNENGVFLKRIDKQEDGLDVPVYMALLSQRRVAVANHRQDNVKIFTF